MPSNNSRLPRPPFVYPATPGSLFLPLTVEIFAGNTTAILDAPISHVPGNPAAYQNAITRLNGLVTDGSLTVKQHILLHAAMNTAQSLVVSGDVHNLLLTIASPATPEYRILDLALVVEAGLEAFIDQPGTSASVIDTGSTKSSTSHIRDIEADCAFREGYSCVVTGDIMGVCCPIIPHSVRGGNADNFWTLVAMFKGPSSTELLKILSLGRPPTTDNIRNVLFLSHGAHACFASGKLAIVPDVASSAYDPATVTEYNAHIELPYGDMSVDLCVWTTAADGTRRPDRLRPGHTITLRTTDPVIRPLPHPILFQLHTVLTRLRKMCASAGISILPEDSGEEEDEDMDVSDYYSEIDYDAMLDNDVTPPKFPENEDWPTISRGLPLTERFLQLLPASDDNKCDYYHRVMDHWTSNEAGSSDLDRQEHHIVKEILE